MNLYKELAYLIREGSKKHPQNFRSLYSFGRTCALGAAMEAYGIDVERLGFSPVVGTENEWVTVYIDKRRFDEHFRLLAVDTQQAIAFLNDSWGWKREKIADWLEFWNGKGDVGISYTLYDEMRRATEKAQRLEPPVDPEVEDDDGDDLDQYFEDIPETQKIPEEPEQPAAEERELVYM